MRIEATHYNQRTTNYIDKTIVDDTRSAQSVKSILSNHSSRKLSAVIDANLFVKDHYTVHQFAYLQHYPDALSCAQHQVHRSLQYGGGEGARTPDLRLAKPALCQTELHPLLKTKSGDESGPEKI